MPSDRDISRQAEDEPAEDGTWWSRMRSSSGEGTTSGLSSGRTPRRRLQSVAKAGRSPQGSDDEADSPDFGRVMSAGFNAELSDAGIFARVSELQRADAAASPIDEAMAEELRVASEKVASRHADNMPQLEPSHESRELPTVVRTQSKPSREKAATVCVCASCTMLVYWMVVFSAIATVYDAPTSDIIATNFSACTTALRPQSSKWRCSSSAAVREKLARGGVFEPFYQTGSNSSTFVNVHGVKLRYVKLLALWTIGTASDENVQRKFIECGCAQISKPKFSLDPNAVKGSLAKMITPACQRCLSSIADAFTAHRSELPPRKAEWVAGKSACPFELSLSNVPLSKSCACTDDRCDCTDGCSRGTRKQPLPNTQAFGWSDLPRQTSVFLTLLNGHAYRRDQGFRHKQELVTSAEQVDDDLSLARYICMRHGWQQGICLSVISMLVRKSVLFLSLFVVLVLAAYAVVSYRQKKLIILIDLTFEKVHSRMLAVVSVTAFVLCLFNLFFTGLAFTGIETFGTMSSCKALLRVRPSLGVHADHSDTLEWSESFGTEAITSKTERMKSAAGFPEANFRILYGAEFHLLVLVLRFLACSVINSRWQPSSNPSADEQARYRRGYQLLCFFALAIEVVSMTTELDDVQWCGRSTSLDLGTLNEQGITLGAFKNTSIGWYQPYKENTCLNLNAQSNDFWLPCETDVDEDKIPKPCELCASNLGGVLPVYNPDTGGFMLDGTDAVGIGTAGDAIDAYSKDAESSNVTSQIASVIFGTLLALVEGALLCRTIFTTLRKKPSNLADLSTNGEADKRSAMATKALRARDFARKRSAEIPIRVLVAIAASWILFGYFVIDMVTRIQLISESLYGTSFKFQGISGINNILKSETAVNLCTSSFAAFIPSRYCRSLLRLTYYVFFPMPLAFGISMFLTLLLAMWSTRAFMRKFRQKVQRMQHLVKKHFDPNAGWTRGTLKSEDIFLLTSTRYTESRGLPYLNVRFASAFIGVYVANFLIVALLWWSIFFLAIWLTVFIFISSPRDPWLMFRFLLPYIVEWSSRKLLYSYLSPRSTGIAHPRIFMLVEIVYMASSSITGVGIVCGRVATALLCTLTHLFRCDQTVMLDPRLGIADGPYVRFAGVMDCVRAKLEFEKIQASVTLHNSVSSPTGSPTAADAATAEDEPSAAEAETVGANSSELELEVPKAAARVAAPAVEDEADEADEES